jgi:signal transduction histidine kinase
MSPIIVLWSVAAGAALTLALVHSLVWLFDRTARSNLMFAVVAVAFAGMTAIELELLHAATPEEYGTWLRWFQVPIFVAVSALVLFIRFYFGSATNWLGWLIIASRGAILAVTFVFGVNFNFDEITRLDRISFLGEAVAVVGQGTVGQWQWIATGINVLLLIYAIDATVRLWRQNGPDARRKAASIGVALVVFLVLSSVPVQIAIWGVVRHAPILVSPAFLVLLLGMGFELSREVLRAARLSRDLRDRDDQLELAVNAAGLGVWAWNVATRSIQATGQTRSLFGIGHGRSLDFDSWCAAVHPDDAAAVRSGLERAAATGTEFKAEFRTGVDGDQVRWLSAHGQLDAGQDGEPTMMRGIVRDITAARQAQEEAKGLRRDLAHAGRVTMLGQLSAAFAHELNQPLGAILRNAEAAAMLLERPNPDIAELREIVSDIRKDDRRAGNVIDHLRALLRRRSMEMQPLQIENVVRDVITLVRGDAAGKHVALDFISRSPLPPTLGDRVHLSQVLLNLILNALDAAQESRGPAPRVTIDAACSDGVIEVAVADSGKGIAPEVINRVFDPFFTTKPHGMGMGLPVSRTIVEAHGGRLWVESNGSGATFRFTVPVSG